mmetsp:Transcript_26324/g.39875  ORF Transcript_26324/g.39875 Transcript_26324/m.39875 type:complete len:81 (-) Transcript_26324:69-311(-)
MSIKAAIISIRSRSKTRRICDLPSLRCWEDSRFSSLSSLMQASGASQFMLDIGEWICRRLVHSLHIEGKVFHFVVEKRQL